MNNAYRCWLCDSDNTRLIKAGNLNGQIHAGNFQITDASYGVTADIYRCDTCDFQFCPTVGEVTTRYEQMEDSLYEATRAERALQARKILELIKRFKTSGALLDIGAGSGILVEQAQQQAFNAAGIEPSLALSKTAQTLGLPVVTGVLPHAALPQLFDVVTLIDVIEHVDTPRTLMTQIGNRMKDNAICIVVTPDIGSLAARLMGKKWWHYRLAHIGYFNTHTLRRLMATANLEIIATHRPGWYFPASYIAVRLLQYLPAPLRIKIPAWLDDVTIPLNLFDSLLVVCRKKVRAEQH